MVRDHRPREGDFRAQLEQQRPYLLRFAALQLRDPSAAEDVVQETLLAALAGEANFAGRSNLRTWLTGILKHKIIDSIRRAAREPRAGPELEDDAAFDDLFRANGHWKDRPSAWDEPHGALEQKQFLGVLEQCLARLPEKTARVFMLREHLGLDTGEICKELDITPTYCWVLLYRARMALRLCLDERWFGKGSGKTADKR
ncbi:MAG TPA: sigma-70 family RNA polymerase sigma factor [Burkholderiales bacterium]|nr:sigma-70 family RNA polymerase sigma factor [Burkholderiales bacterium]